MFAEEVSKDSSLYLNVDIRERKNKVIRQKQKVKHYICMLRPLESKTQVLMIFLWFIPCCNEIKPTFQFLLVSFR